MTAHAHEPSMSPPDDAVDAAMDATNAGGTSTRPRWLVPGLAIGIVVAALVAAGVVSFSTALYAAMFGGMMLMHVGGHGMHGGHRGGGHEAHGGGASPDGPASDAPQGPPQLEGSGSAPETSPEGSADGRGREAQPHEEPRSHGCH